MADNPEIAIEYLRRLDTGGDLFELFTDDAVVFLPKWGLATGLDEVRRMFADVGRGLAGIKHDLDGLNVITQGDTVVLEGTSAGSLPDGGTWDESRWCDVFEFSGGRIRRLHIYLDPDYCERDTARYPWHAS